MDGRKNVLVIHSDNSPISDLIELSSCPSCVKVPLVVLCLPRASMQMRSQVYGLIFYAGHTQNILLIIQDRPHKYCHSAYVRNNFNNRMYSFTFQIYFLASAVIAATFLHEQREFLAGDIQKPTGESFLEREAISSSKC